MRNLVDDYLTHNLTPLLLEFGANTEVVSKVCADINSRLSSIIYRWSDEEFRSTILLHGIEEATYYSPVSDINIRALVVVCIRNSLLEDLSSTRSAAKSLGLSNPIISDDQIKKITSDAITFFSNNDLLSASQQITKPLVDPFEKIQFEYPLAWYVMRKLSKCTNFTTFGAKEILKSNDYTTNKSNASDIFVEVQSGIDPTINHTLNKILESIRNRKQHFFFSDSFKMITRHPEKLYKIIESVLNANAPVVTFNYYISNGYVARRTNLLKPAHSEKDLNEKYKNTNGLRKAHLEIIKIMR
ncbi:hypothetical protein U9M73_12980 [Paenibacillus phoenicis]|uniref:Uncharacterized protein n=1 Tax=Paenibacillus phoenicis TaxID=554117 RepID=A0ABU5PLS3_9BACL|nr:MULTISPECIES: hypothetical protein [Paenibacillus]EES72909.1 hypothetical protein POTG_02316 [Paenibacillus sp. oral taxon 786 str. D14]MEA3570899.1 hypothetical protein [Paenibacillus phoenicis]